MRYTGGTDNQGNARLTVRHLTTRFPLCAILMEVAARMSSHGRSLSLAWLPRDQNYEADELSNFDFRRFDMARRVEVDLEKVQWLVLPELLQYGAELYADVEA
eukprot:495578-Lingulodinium_polyedra.AAC.1